MNKININKRSLKVKPKVLRSIGKIPGIFYGPDVKNQAVEISIAELRDSLTRPGEVYVVSSEQEQMLAKMGEIQRDPLTKEISHFSLVQMPSYGKSEVDVPIGLKGTPIGVKKGGILVVLKDDLVLTGQPRQIPDEVEGNVSRLDIGDNLRVHDLNIPTQLNSLENEHEVSF